MIMLSFLKLYRDANRLWHLNELSKHLNAICEPLCKKFECSIGCPLKIENTCAKGVIKDYIFKERGKLDDWQGVHKQVW